MATTNRNKLLSNAQRYLEKGNLTRAIKEYKKLLDTHPDDVRVRLRIGDLQARLGKRAEAIATYEEVADEYQYQGFYLKSVAVLKQILRLDPSRSDVHLRLAELYQHLNLLSDGMAQYREVASQFKQQGETERYIDVLGRIAEIDPDDVSTHITMGEQLSELGRTNEAAEAFANAADRLYEFGRLKEFAKVSERYTFHAQADLMRLKRLIRVYLERGDPKRALAKLQLLFKQKAEDVEGLELLVEAFLAIDKTTKAIRVLKELAEQYTSQGQEELAIESYRRVIGLNPKDSDARIQLGLAPPPDPQPEESGPDSDLIPVEAAAPPEGDAPISPGEIHNDKADQWRRLKAQSGLYAMPSGMTTCNKELDRGSVELIGRLLVEVDGFAKVGLFQRAQDTLERVFKVDPLNVTARERAVQLAFERGRVKDAVSQLLLLTRLTWTPDPARAATYLHRALHQVPDDAEATELRHDLGLDGIDLETFMLDRSENDLELVEITPESAGAPATARSKLPPQELVDRAARTKPPADQEPTVPLTAASPPEESDQWNVLTPTTDPTKIPHIAKATEQETEVAAQPTADSLEEEIIFVDDPDSEDFIELVVLDDPKPAVEARKPPPAIPADDNGTPNAVNLNLPPLPDNLPDDLLEDLKELEFYASVGLDDEVQSLLFDLTNSFPEHAPMIMERMAAIERQVNK